MSAERLALSDPGPGDGLIDALELAGCSPRPAGPGVWFAECPTCRRAGRTSLVEIRAGGVMACVSAHEPPRVA